MIDFVYTHNVDTLNYMMKDGWELVIVEPTMHNTVKFMLKKDRVVKKVLATTRNSLQPMET